VRRRLFLWCLDRFCNLFVEEGVFKVVHRDQLNGTDLYPFMQLSMQTALVTMLSFLLSARIPNSPIYMLLRQSEVDGRI
jgi:hypothetical protein